MTEIAACRECGKPFERKKWSALHCSSGCRLAFNTRRRNRGAELYDFIMAGGQREMVDRLIRSYKIADRVLRDGRHSFQPTTQATMRISPSYDGAKGDNRA